MNFKDNWNQYHNGWNIYNPNNKFYKINTFDDGLKKYEIYLNTWLKYGDGYNGQKIALVNKENFNIQIGSISNWKVDLIEELKDFPS